MLMGDVTKLVQPSDRVEDLREQAKGSPLLAQALAHVPVSEQKRRVEGFDNLQQVFAAYEPVVVQAGCEMRFRTEDVDGYSEHLEVFGFTPTGRRSKKVTLSLSYFTTAFDELFDENGKIYHANHRPRVRPWTVRKGGVPTSRKELATSLPDFIDGVEELVQRSRRTE
ncbi:hypothetical protein [Pannonibacter tanglangensis]|nr:hypothetical protein [Pannonibacter sp. XCT-34]